MPTPSPLRILVTGGAGFLGSWLCERLLDAGHQVICLDDFSTGLAQNVAALADHPHFSLVRHDVTEPFDAEVDRIYNLACPASPLHYQRDPVRTLRTCVLGAINMLELARRRGARILQASTSEIYGDPEVSPQSETYPGRVNATGPRACYDEGKRCAETLFHDYHRQYGVRIKIARIFNSYGPRMRADDGRVVSNFIVQALAGSPITLYGDGHQTRSFCYVDDLLDGLERLMETPDAQTGPYNIGNPEEVSIRELAERILAATGSLSEIVNGPLPADDPRQRRPDISLIRGVIPWEPVTRLDGGLARTIEHFRRTL